MRSNERYVSLTQPQTRAGGLTHCATGASTSSSLGVVKDCLGVTGSFLSMLLKHIPDMVDTNPVKVAFAVAQAVVEMKEVGSIICTFISFEADDIL